MFLDRTVSALLFLLIFVGALVTNGWQSLVIAAVVGFFYCYENQMKREGNSNCANFAGILFCFALGGFIINVLRYVIASYY